MDIRNKAAIRSSGWRTDLLIGFPDGLLLLLFTTQILHGKSLTVQAFYSLHILILGIATLLMMIAVFRANRGDEHDDEGRMSKEEKQRLLKLDISQGTIEHIADEMKKDQEQWENTLQEEHVQLQQFGLGHAIRSTLATGAFFLLGGLIAFVPYLAQENFTKASELSLTLCIFALLFFAYLKSRITGQHVTRMALRYVLTGGLVILASYLIAIAI
ncbi:VIT1/CCC1 transporter family protein [Chitinophaga niabensis]|uniref:Predicted Fe2+/Mn2+ transporter, VIT1/CCC1 family n=1 Tax=Chitinophaga niabensis TaxID=536979 RepID=A0A1N6EB32_9BACT|nr:VIT1/CCC1 transporter family protein [Chitinophaga niabensis]SIN80255.1 Predicted Fe2+/Mn2+ transporter, VIT1/CCC1 family [Chitinophaga niabensis]